MGAPAGNQIQAKGSLQTLNRQNDPAKQSKRKAGAPRLRSHIRCNELKANAARYPKMVERSDEAGGFMGTCPGLMYGSIHGQAEDKVYAELCQAVEEVLEILETDGHALPEPLAVKKFSGKFVVRVEPALHRRLALKPRVAGESLNSIVTKTPRREDQRRLEHGPLVLLVVVVCGCVCFRLCFSSARALAATGGPGGYSR